MKKPWDRRSSRRQFLKRTAAGGLGLALAPSLLAPRSAYAESPYIQAYTDRPSYDPGDVLILRVSTTEPEFRVRFYRQGRELMPTEWSSAWFGGAYADAGRADEDFRWPGYEIPIPADLPGGAYIAMLDTRDRNGVVSSPDVTTSYGVYGKALVVIRRDRASRATILYKLATNTYHAYNHGKLFNDFRDLVGGNLVANEKEYFVDGLYVGSRVTMLRPGGGTGGDWEDGGFAWGDPPGSGVLVDPYQGGSRRNTFAHWDASMISWLESSGYAVDYCTDLDVHEDDSRKLLDTRKYRTLLSAGHDEYWSLEMRDHVQSFIQRGGNVAFFSGDAISWRVTYCDRNTGFYSNKLAPEFLDRWWDGQGLPSNFVSGVGSRNAGYAYGAHDPSGYTVQYAKHWVYAGTGLFDRDVFAAKERLVSYEADGARYQWDPGSGLAAVELNADTIAVDRTPSRFTILGTFEMRASDGSIGLPGWEYTDRETGDAPRGATMGIYSSGGTVFSGGTTDWARVVRSNAAVDQITRNVLDTFGTPRRVVGLAYLNADRLIDILLQHPRTNEISYWVMDGMLPSGGGCFFEPELGPEWSVAASAPLRPKSDGGDDLLLQNGRTGEVRYWLMDGATKVEEGAIDFAAGSDLRLAAAGDLDLDGGADLLFQSRAKGSLEYVLLSDLRPVQQGTIDGMGPEWSLVALRDLTGSGSNDLVWQNTQTGEVAYWLMKGLDPVERGSFGFGEGWTLVGCGDFDDDGNNDLLFQHPKTNELMVWSLYGLQVIDRTILSVVP